MRSQGREERHRHVALVATAADVAPIIPGRTETARLQAGGVSLLRLSVPARLLMVAAAAALLWGAVLWALA
jgi:hypothetical protein